jgi:hypothetical protein
MPFWPHWTIGGVLPIGGVTALVGLAWMPALQRSHRDYFSGASMSDGYSITADDKVVRVAGPWRSRSGKGTPSALLAVIMGGVGGARPRSG